MILSENRFTLFGTMRRALSDLPQACLSGRARYDRRPLRPDRALAAAEYPIERFNGPTPGEAQTGQ